MATKRLMGDWVFQNETLTTGFVESSAQQVEAHLIGLKTLQETGRRGATSERNIAVLHLQLYEPYGKQAVTVLKNTSTSEGPHKVFRSSVLVQGPRFVPSLDTRMFYGFEVRYSQIHSFFYRGWAGLQCDLSDGMHLSLRCKETTTEINSDTGAIVSELLLHALFQHRKPFSLDTIHTHAKRLQELLVVLVGGPVSIEGITARADIVPIYLGLARDGRKVEEQDLRTLNKVPVLPEQAVGQDRPATPEGTRPSTEAQAQNGQPSAELNHPSQTTDASDLKVIKLSWEDDWFSREEFKIHLPERKVTENPHKPIFHFDDIQTDLHTMIPEFFQLDRTMQRAFSLLANSKTAVGLTVDHRFMNHSSALDSLLDVLLESSALDTRPFFVKPEIWEPLVAALEAVLKNHQGLKSDERRRIRGKIKDANNKPMAFKSRAIFVEYWPAIQKVTDISLEDFDQMVIENRNRLAHNSNKDKDFILAGTRSFYFTAEIIGVVATVELLKMLGLKRVPKENERLLAYMRKFWVDTKDLKDHLTF